MEIPPEVRYVVRDGRSIAYQRFGSGQRRAVSFGNIGNLDLQWSDPSFYEVALQSADRGEMLIFDQLGFGLSDPVDHIPTTRSARSTLAQ
jgi:pimeloyl-ACP methyl ester carboxylesterase